VECKSPAFAGGHGAAVAARDRAGSFTLKSYAGPVHYHAAAGRLQDLNLSLRSQVAGEYAHVADGAPFSVRAGWHHV